MEEIIFELDLLEEARDVNTLVVATHGIIKKSQKTPQSDITKAEIIRKKYFENKNKKI